MIGTKIQWADDSVNPVMGCDGCELWAAHGRTSSADAEVATENLFRLLLCYAGKQHLLRGGKVPGYAPNFLEPTVFPGRTAAAAKRADLRGKERSDKPWLSGFPRLIFVSDMGDALSKDIPFELLNEEIARVAESEEGRRHIWIWLTKRPTRLAEFSAWILEIGGRWPPNLWVGTSITKQSNVSRIHGLLRVGDANTVRMLSVEPQLEALDFSSVPLNDIDWVIHGGASATDDFPFAVEWARELRDQCVQLGVSYFLKQLGQHSTERGERLVIRDRHGGDWDEWPDDLQVRQMPRLNSPARLERISRAKVRGR